MRKCHTVKGLAESIIHGEFAVLKVWDMMEHPYDPDGAYLNLGEGRYVYVGSNTFKLIRHALINEDGYFCKDLRKYRQYYQSNTSKTA